MKAFHSFGEGPNSLGYAALPALGGKKPAGPRLSPTIGRKSRMARASACRSGRPQLDPWAFPSAFDVTAAPRGVLEFPVLRTRGAQPALGTVGQRRSACWLAAAALARRGSTPPSTRRLARAHLGDHDRLRGRDLQAASGTSHCPERSSLSSRPVYPRKCQREGRRSTPKSPQGARRQRPSGGKSMNRSVRIRPRAACDRGTSPRVA
jgi:hypothetical protein